MPIADVVLIHHNNNPINTPKYRSLPVSNRAILTSLGLPPGLQDEVLKSTAEFAKRYWIIDNSGSMVSGDGNAFVESESPTHSGMVGCSRWQELIQSLKWAGNLAIDMQSPLQIFPLNPVHGCNQCVSLGNGRPQEERQQLSSLCSSSPSGRTPICAQIRAVVRCIKSQEQALRHNGQQVVVTIATDGLSTDGEVEEALAPLEHLPVWCVIKLCTDEEQVVNFWNNIDAQLEIDMEVLDDLEEEAKEVHEMNGWLTYNLLLHRVREWGSSSKLLDMLDEVKFTKAQAHELVGLVLGSEAAEALPPPALDIASFVKEAGSQAAALAKVWDPISKEQKPWFSAAALGSQFH